MKFKLLSGLLVVTSAVFMYCGCSKDLPVTNYKTRNVIIVVVDGPRITETWEYPNRSFIPHRAALLKDGVFCSNFYNKGFTWTSPGHQAMCTGVYENINNGGAELPSNPSIFQYWRKAYNRPASETWVITTKDKLEVLSNCNNPDWKDTYRPSTDCGNNGLGTGYREDFTTFVNTSNKLLSNHVRLAIVNFKQPDAAGHALDSLGYIQGIIDTDNYISQLWNLIQTTDFYKDQTTLIVTNDHGRHTAGYMGGYPSHGDACEGCSHIEFFALGPDFKKNYTCATAYEQLDISATVAELMGFSMPTCQGKVMKDIFK